MLKVLENSQFFLFGHFLKISNKLTKYHGWDSIVMITMISRKKLGLGVGDIIMKHTVLDLIRQRTFSLCLNVQFISFGILQNWPYFE